MKLSAIQRFTMLDFPNRIACIAFTPGCNLRCGFCHNPEFVLPTELRRIHESFIAPETFFNFLIRRQGLLDGVVVSGGEPTVWPDLPEFLAKIKSLGFAVKLDTNGNAPVMLERLIRDGLVDSIAMDVKTAADQYRALVGPAVQPEQIQKSMDVMRESGIEHEFRTTLISEHHTASVLREMETWFQPGDRLFLQVFRPGHTLSPHFAAYHGFISDQMEVIAEQFRRIGLTVAVRI